MSSTSTSTALKSKFTAAGATPRLFVGANTGPFAKAAEVYR
jgi:hypothetical protein